MQKTINISFPRSGHHLLVNLLIKYFSKDLNAITTDGTKIRQESSERLNIKGFNYCEFYKHCRKPGCTDLEVNFQKNHDFELKFPIMKDFDYIIQYRYPLDSIVSNYESFRLKNQTKKRWEEYALEKIYYWKKFVNKWAINKEFLHIKYEDLIHDPQRILIKVLKEMKVEDIDYDFIKKIKILQKKKRDFTKFHFYDKKFFKKLEKIILKELVLLNIPPKFYNFNTITKKVKRREKIKKFFNSFLRVH